MVPNISISIVSWNTREYLRQCLQSIKDNVKGVQCEVIVADNTSSDASAEMVEESFPEVKLLKNKENLGYAKANNQIFRLARGKYFLLLNPDTIVLKDSLEKLSGFLDNNPDAAAVAPKFLNPDRTFQKFYRRFPNLSFFISQMTVFSILISAKVKKKLRDDYFYDNESDSFENVRIVEQAAASCLLLRKDAFKNEELFDEAFPIFFNDVDLCKKIDILKRKVYFLPESEIIHFCGQGVKQLDAKREMEYSIGWLRYIKKYDGIVCFVAAQLALVVSYLLLGIGNFLAFIAFRKSFGSVRRNFSIRMKIILCRSNFN